VSHIPYSSRSCRGFAPRARWCAIAFVAVALQTCVQLDARAQPASPSDLAPPAPASTDAAPQPPEAAPSAVEEVADVTVSAQRRPRTEDRAASDFTISRDVIAAAPRQEGAEVLRSVPGLYIARAEGGAVGHRYMLRGFDADHGQDLELSVGGLPINIPSHIHGQGYADLGFLIAETVEALQVKEGVYDPRQGDFAVAGSIDVQLGVERRGVTVRSTLGSFDAFRQLVLWAPPDASDSGTFGAAQYSRTDGFGENRRGQAASAIVQTVLGEPETWRYRVLGILYGARSELAGVLRAGDVDAGQVGFYDVYPYATARAQNGFAARLLTGLFADHQGPSGDATELGLWAGLDDFRLQENFTGFIQRSQTLENVAGRGDLIEQQNRTKSLGVRGRYRSAPYRPAAWMHGTLELGLAGRLDESDQAQNLLDASVRRQTWDRRVDASILGADLGLWGDLEGQITRAVRLRAGLRADALYYDVSDRLGNFAPLTRPQDTYIVGFRRSAFGLAWGPRASAEVNPTQGLSLRAAYGEGYRSPQARTLDDGEPAPFSKVRSVDLGARLAWHERYELTLAAYYTVLSDDVAFDAEEGRLERIGQTRRLGAVLDLRARPLEGLVGALSVTFVDAELLEPPPPTPEEPEPPFRAGQNLPFVPPIVVRLDLGAHSLEVGSVGAWGLVGHAGAGFSFLSPRPLPFGQFADPVALLDGAAGLAWGPLDLALELFNVFDARYAASELYFASTWDPEAARTRAPVRHLAAGAPFTWLLTLGLAL
jgi:outer membrane receptor protein involved in Fe transport